jgi:hypothetical protein
VIEKKILQKAILAKNEELDADFESIEKLRKKSGEKLYQPKSDKRMEIHDTDISN